MGGVVLTEHVAIGDTHRTSARTHLACRSVKEANTHLHLTNSKYPQLPIPALPPASPSAASGYQHGLLGLRIWIPLQLYLLLDLVHQEMAPGFCNFCHILFIS
ncbi:hypothetical protein GDO81_002817 [Engystomops pustulosus]|uniref:Uncharacterized protein n=1 Tax=Engystomops pustulosus TaxID=76066 RepID=A0AAV7DN41_ENGPU|nr:hypothetical protein GDO81_002817 [Engystomops pustulosus]